MIVQFSIVRRSSLQEMFDKDGNINGVFIGGGGESIAYRMGKKVVKFPMNRLRIRTRDFAKKLSEMNYPTGSGRIPKIRNFRKLTSEQKKQLSDNRLYDDRFSNIRYVYETDYIPNEVHQWEPNLVVQSLMLFQTLLGNGFAVTDIAGQNWRTDRAGRLYFIDDGDIRYADVCIEHKSIQTTFLFYLSHILQYAFGANPKTPLIDLLKEAWPGWADSTYKGGGYGNIDWRISRCFLPVGLHKILKDFQELTMDTIGETMIHVGDAIELIKQGKVGSAGQPSTVDIIKGIYSDYQLAQVRDDYTLTPEGYSAGKWSVVSRAARVLDTQQFSWLDLGACYGLFGFMLAQEYPQSTGILNNIDRAELVATRFVAHIKGVSGRVKTQECSWKDTKGTYDFVLCMSLVHHLLGSGHTVKTFCDSIKTKVNPGGILVLEVPTSGDFQGQLLEKTHMGRTVDVVDFIPELPEFDLLWKERVNYMENKQFVRNVGIFRKR